MKPERLFALLVTSVACACSTTNGDQTQTQMQAPTQPSDGGTTSGNSDTGKPSGTPDGSSQGDSGTPIGVKGPVTIVTIVMENHDYEEVVGSPDAPYINSLIASYGLATNYMDAGIHPSLPNYLTMISGAPQYPGIIDLNPNTFPFPVAQQNLGTQLEAAGIEWRSYQESMPSPCTLGTSSPYGPKHDPFLYFTDMQKSTPGLCAKRNVAYTEFAADLAAGTYRYMWITPNLTNDGHDPSNDPVTGLKQTDAWAHTEVDKILASPTYKSGGIIFITWDEAEGRNGHSADKIPMIVISPKIKSPGYTSSNAYSHKSYLATVEDLLGVPRLPTVASEPSMLEFFAP